MFPVNTDQKFKNSNHKLAKHKNIHHNQMKFISRIQVSLMFKTQLMEYNIPLLKDKPQAHLSKQRKIILTNLSPIIDLKKKKGLSIKQEYKEILTMGIYEKPATNILFNAEIVSHSH